MSKLDLTFSDIYNQVSDFLGCGLNPTGSVLTKVQNIVWRAYRQFLFPVHPATGRKHHWSFLKKLFTLQTKTGVWKYQLPLDFGEMLGQPHYGEGELYNALTKVSPDMLLEQRSKSEASAWPMCYAISPVSTSSELGTTWELWLYPTPGHTYTIRLSYEVIPEKPTNPTDVILGGPLAGEVVLEMSLAEAELQEENVLGNHAQRASTLLAQMILADTVTSPDSLGTLRGTGFKSCVCHRPMDNASIYTDYDTYNW